MMPQLVLFRLKSRYLLMLVKLLWPKLALKSGFGIELVQKSSIQVCNAQLPMFANSPDVAAVSDDDFSVDSSPYVEM